jgi:hypothetical protein
MTFKIPKGLVMANLPSKPKYDRNSFSSKQEAFNPWEQDVGRMFELAFPVKVKDTPLYNLDFNFDPFATGSDFDMYGLDKFLDFEEIAKEVVDSRVISAQVHKEAKKMAYSVFYLWTHAQAQLYDLLKAEFGKSERSLVNEYHKNALQTKLNEYGFRKDSMDFKILSYGSLLFASIRKTQVESTSFSVLHKLANQQKALDGWTQIEGSGPGSLPFVLDKLLEAKNATISLPFDHIQSLLMIAKLSTCTHGDWNDWAARFYEDQELARTLLLLPRKWPILSDLMKL